MRPGLKISLLAILGRLIQERGTLVGNAANDIVADR